MTEPDTIAADTPPPTPATAPPPDRPKRRRRGWRIAGIVTGAIVLLLVVLALLFRWDWLIPLIDARASAALGRKVSIAHLHGHLGRTTTFVADDVEIANPDGFDADPPLAKIEHLTVSLLPLAWLHGQGIVIPEIALDHPEFAARGKADGSNNWGFPGLAKKPGAPASSSPPPKIGALRIDDGTGSVIAPKFKANIKAKFHTVHEDDPHAARLLLDADGTYAKQPISVRFSGGSLLSLQDHDNPYPLDLKIANGPTHASLDGTVDDPMAFAGAKLKLAFSGPDMALLLPLTGIAIPHTPAYSVTGNLDYRKSHIVFDDMHGRVGHSDLNGRISVDPHGKVPDLDADLNSKNVDLTDLAGFIGGDPGGGAKVPHKNKGVLPDQTFNVPAIRSLNAHVAYRGAHIEGYSMPLDSIVAVLDLHDGRIRLDPLNFAVGKGQIQSRFDLQPRGHEFATTARIAFQKVDISRLMRATHMFNGDGHLGGQADLTTTGNSVATMLGNGNGGITLIVDGHGDISALLHDIAGLEIGPAILSALGVPERADLRCFIADMPLRDGILSTKTFLLQSSEARTIGQGTINLKAQTIDYSLTTRSSHFTVGSLPGPVNITGPLDGPSIRPGAEIVGRAAAATGLGIVLPPLALLPMVQFGVGEGACTEALQETKQAPAAKPIPAGRHHRHG
ncbi:hypothetical protein FHR90_002553 [Endobacter medicaginis]|uniref:AsmA domain-containing protein n=1 Tax=Endobacter medicaginis TaxID=1181271 RepID=A0A839UY06_9PROT|nr:AsmA family protein [Endobacter medicaginis]MBB3174707.1 hypothetical protein [Endobacter medicaginis]MCX5474898.1 AsmA family protein [Endobacter medicaginis]